MNLNDPIYYESALEEDRQECAVCGDIPIKYKDENGEDVSEETYLTSPEKDYQRVDCYVCEGKGGYDKNNYQERIEYYERLECHYREQYREQRMEQEKLSNNPLKAA